MVEAGRRSGALITAGWALEQGRECLLVPGPLDSRTSEGCNAFLRCFPGQTRVVCGIPELLEDLGLAGSRGAETAPAGSTGAETAPAGSTGAETAPARLSHKPSSAAPSAGTSATLAALAGVERQLAEILCYGSVTADELARRAALPGATVLGALTLLELRGLVVSAYGRYSAIGSLATWPGKGRVGQGK